MLALIAGIGVFSLRPNNDGATVEVASEPATAATSAVQDGSDEGGSGDSQDEPAEETTGEPSDDPDQGDQGDDGQELETAGGTDPTEDGPESVDPAEPEAEDPNPCSHDGFEPSVNGCVRYEAPVIECVEGELDLDGLSCVIVGETLPVPGFVCPQDENVIDDGVSCYELIPRNDCGDLSELPSSAGDGPRCRRTVDLVPGPLACEAGFAFQAGECVRYLEPR